MPRTNQSLNIIKSNNAGFTLVELSVVLVIIGLIVGGIMTGTDLIKSSTIRAQIAQIQNYQAAINAFSDKYDNLPGDIPPEVATPAGMTLRSGAAAHGDGDSDVNAGCGTNELGCENILFWSDLSHEKLIKESFTAATDALLTADQSNIEEYVPRGKIKGVTVKVRYYWQITGNAFALYNTVSYVAGASTANGAALTPQQASEIDTKIDDGKGLTGSVLGNLDGAGLPIGPAVCVTDAAGSPYNTTIEDYATHVSCYLYLRFE